MGLFEDQGAFFGNPSITAQGVRGRAGKRDDVASGPMRAFLEGLGGTMPDEQSGSVLDPNSARNSPVAANLGMGLGGLAQALPLVKSLLPALGAAETFGSRSVKMYNPQPVAQRPFSHDYPTANAGPTGSPLRFDIEGRPLTATYIAGRKTWGGADQGLSAGEINGLPGLFQVPTRTATKRELGKDVGQYERTPLADGTTRREIRVYQGLLDGEKDGVYAHEVGHMLEDLGRKYQSGWVNLDGVKGEVSRVYNDLNNPVKNMKGLLGPADHGYKGSDIEREYIAETLRAALIDPNYAKTAAPKTLALLREHINSNPNVNQILQLNSAGGAAGLGALGYNGEPRR